MGVEVAGAVPGASWGLLMALSELRDEAAGDEAPPTPPATDPEADAPAPRGKLGRLSLLGLVEAEAGRLARRNAAGELMARALRALAEDLRWTRARTPAEHDARMDAWDSWVRDHEPMEATR